MAALHLQEGFGDFRKREGPLDNRPNLQNTRRDQRLARKPAISKAEHQWVPSRRPPPHVPMSGVQLPFPTSPPSISSLQSHPPFHLYSTSPPLCLLAHSCSEPYHNPKHPRMLHPSLGLHAAWHLHSLQSLFYLFVWLCV